MCELDDGSVAKILFNFLKRVNKKNINFDLYNKIEVNINYTKTQLLNEFCMSLDKLNYSMKKLDEKGWIKFSNFRNNLNKINYILIHTSKGII